ncbi:MAG: serine/threonine-protein kinase [Planctomycetota bacterium]
MNQSSDPVLDAVLAQYLVAIEDGDQAAIDKLFEEHPQFKEEIEKFAENKRLIDRIAQTMAPGPAGSSLAGRSPIGAFVAPTVGELQSLLDQFEVLELIGQGAMGAVYKARQIKLDRIVALKVLPSHTAADPLFAERFVREARAMARLVHGNIVTIFDFGECEGCCYLVMEFVDGVNLRQAITTGKVEPAEALSIVPQLCDALFYAHQQGIVHRDVKPENILLDKDGVVKIADFGLAKMLNETTAQPYLTATQQVLGTLRYMAPEQLEGSRDIDHRADIYSLGVVFYELLTGQLPVGRFEMPSEAADVDARLDDVVARTLERSPDRRYQQASEIKTDIHGISENVAFPAVASSPRTMDTNSSSLNRPGESSFYEFSWVSLFFGGIVTLALIAPFLPATGITFTNTVIDHTTPDTYEFFSAKSMDEPMFWFPFVLTLTTGIWFLLTIQTRYLASRALLAIGSGLALIQASALKAVLNPFPLSSRYEHLLDYSTYMPLSSVLNMERHGQLDITFQQLTGFWLTLIAGILLTLLGILEFHTSEYWKTEKSKSSVDKDTFRVPGTLLKLTGWTSIVFAACWWVVIFIYQFWGSLAPDAMFTARCGGVWSAYMHSIYVVAFSVVLISGGNAMLRCQNRAMASAACIVAMIPLNYAAAIGIPVGVLGLFLLNSSKDVDRLFAANRLETQVAQRRLRIAGVIQFICSLLGLFIWAIIIFISLSEYGVFSNGITPDLPAVTSIGLAQHSTGTFGNGRTEANWATLLFAFVILLIMAWVVSSYLFMKQRSYIAMWVSVILGLIPHSPVSVVTIPLSIWTILFCRQKFAGGDPEIQRARDLFNSTAKSGKAKS